MRLLVKFNLLLLLVFAASLAVTGYLTHSFLQQSTRQEVIDQARLMMGAAGGMRTYTSQQLEPLLAAHEREPKKFAPQRVPAYSATEVFNYLRQDNPAYTYKEATLNPTNLRDRALGWEADIIEAFRNDARKTELIAQRQTPLGASLILARPIVAAPECLSCDGTPSSAPASMIATYGRDNGFGWNAGEVVAAQIISVPMSVPVSMANRAFNTLIISVSGVFLFTLALLDLSLIFIVVQPVDRLSRMADEISRGNLNAPDVPAKGSDEISRLARAFNQMHQSLVKALSKSREK